MRSKYKLGDLITQRREKNNEIGLPISGVSKDGLIPPKQIDADTSIYNIFYRKDFIFNPARMELNSIAFNDIYDKAICSSLYEVFYVHRTDLIIPEYLALIVKQNWFTRYCEFLGQGSAREYCRFVNISEIEIVFPNIEIQKKIVYCYNVINKRITIKQRINDNLADTAQAIFKHSFIDATSEGLPSTWSEVPLFQVADLGAGGDRPDVFSDVRTPECPIPIFSNGIENEGLYGYTDKSRVQAESVTISARGTVGYVFLRQEPFVPIVRLIYITPKDDRVTAKYLFFALRYAEMNSTGTSQQQITVPDFKNTPIIVPNADALAEFMCKITPLFDEMNCIKGEVDKLKTLQSVMLQTISSH